MNRIRLLSEQVANQIAAGEVVERPASVVKELVENALDAGAERIQVEIQAGGRSLVRVTDDGCGMSRDDALLSLERHATSKIRQAEDLFAISTMGFRGEALPSIASVSRFTLTTREREATSLAGTRVVVNGGKIQEVKEAGCPPGTCVEVRQIFFNLPARRKFLRSEETEASHIQHYLTLAALAHPAVAFTWIKDGRTFWQLPPVKGVPRQSGATAGADSLGALRERHRALYGAEVKLLALDFSGALPVPAFAETEQDGESSRDEAPGEAPTLRIHGFIGAPGVSRATREEQHVFVNRRPVENRGVNAALLEGYHTVLMKGRYPVCVLFLELPPALVDVNIHPAKREVKFHHERAVRALVTRAVRECLLKFHSAMTESQSLSGIVGRSPASSLAPASVPPAGGTPWAAPPRQQPLAAPGGEPMEIQAEPIFQRPLAVTSAAQAGLSPGVSPVTSPGSSAGGASVPASRSVSPAGPSSGALPPVTAGEPVPLLRVPLRMVGVIGKLYVVLESDRGLVLLDQHAAHERILFEQMLDRLEREHSAPSQRLLLPETVELPPRDAHFLKEQLPTLTRLGVGLSEFGERTFLLDALPPFVKVSDPRQFVIGLVDELKAAGSEVNTLRLGEHTVAKTVCRHAVKANDPLQGMELQNLVDDLRRCAMPYTCPHGRPTLLEMNWRELEKKFGRSQ